MYRGRHQSVKGLFLAGAWPVASAAAGPDHDASDVRRFAVARARGFGGTGRRRCGHGAERARRTHHGSGHRRDRARTRRRRATRPRRHDRPARRRARRPPRPSARAPGSVRRRRPGRARCRDGADTGAGERAGRPARRRTTRRLRSSGRSSSSGGREVEPGGQIAAANRGSDPAWSGSEHNGVVDLAQANACVSFISARSRASTCSAHWSRGSRSARAAATSSTSSAVHWPWSPRSAPMRA